MKSLRGNEKRDDKPQLLLICLLTKAILQRVVKGLLLLLLCETDRCNGFLLHRYLKTIPQYRFEKHIFIEKTMFGAFI